MLSGDYMTAKDCGIFIANLRKDKGLTQKQLADALNVSDKAISRWETGKGYPDVSSLVALSDFFSVSVNEILAGKNIESEAFPEIADTNLLTVFKEKEKTKKNNIFQIIICFIMFVLIFCPVLIFSGKELIEQLKIYVTTENLTEALIELLVALFMLISGFLVSKGFISLLHSYHYRNVTDRNGYCKEIGKAIMLLSVPFLLSGFFTLFASVKIVSILSTIILIGGEAAGFIWIFKIQIKYNGGLF